MSLDDEIRHLKRLSPSERIRKLKELEEEQKKEIEETGKLIEESREEENVEREEKTQLPAPQMKAINADALETIEAKLLWAAKRGITIPAKESDVAPRAEPRKELTETVEEEQKQARNVSSAAYGGQLMAAMDEQKGAAVVEAYRNKPASVMPDEAYDTITKQKDMAAAYQKPEMKTEITYHERKATAGHEREQQPQDFYTTTTDNKKKKTAFY